MTNSTKTHVSSSVKCRQQVHAWIDRYFDNIEAQLTAQLKKTSAPEAATERPERQETAGRAEPAIGPSPEPSDEKLEQFFRYMRSHA